jgi:carbonic anhydrase/acetyltransferase-like protein (isoleucine patch superfamily)
MSNNFNDYRHMNKKYKFTGETFKHRGATLRRIVALRSFGEVEEGTVGGWIEKESNLSHDGNCWVGDEAMVYREACVFGDAQVFGHARVHEHAHVYGSARVCEYAHVYGRARVCEDAQVYEHAHVYGSAWVYEYALVYGHAHLSGDERVCGDAELSSDILPEELNALPESIEEVTIKGMKYKKVPARWEKV